MHDRTLRATLGGALLFLSVAAPALRAQAIPTDQDLAAEAALISTPIGALSPLMTPTIAGMGTASPSFGIRYGRRSVNGGNGSEDNYGIATTLPMGSGTTITITAAAGDLDCSGCNRYLQLALGGDFRLGEMPMGSGSKLLYAVNGEVGYGRPSAFGQTDQAISLSAGVPISLVLGSGSDMKIVPWLTPGFGIGRYKQDTRFAGTSESGQRFLLGGGLGLANAGSSFSASVGFQHVFITGGQTMYGISVTIGGK
ncbi:MAG: hypothetical protein JWO05_2679 [Gemmatimonadetes bacterium]|nr:hypothetical protein [Gemmatimonadota bacterium]